jgi:GT2 family glycosyltransferase
VIDLSVIIVNYRGWKRLAQCLDALINIPQNRFHFEVIIVDNASGDGMLKKFEEQYRSFSFVENEGNHGFANGCNKGASLAKGKSFLFLNPDTIASELALYKMLRKLDSCRKNCIVSCRQLKEDGSEEKSFGTFLSPFTLTGWLRGLNKIFSGSFEKKLSHNHDSLSPDWISGSVVMLSRADFEELGGWDEDFWMYYEDVDLCRRARAGGGEIYLLNTVFVEHNHGGASRINPSITALTKTEVFISRHVYLSKHSKGLSKWYMQSFLVLNNLLTVLLPALLGIPFFFSKKLRIYLNTYVGLLKYYNNCLLHQTWLSSRSVNYPRITQRFTKANLIRL